jgi:hypothetical protein
MYSISVMAIEYASSPVEQPTTQIRTGCLSSGPPATGGKPAV